MESLEWIGRPFLVDEHPRERVLWCLELQIGENAIDKDSRPNNGFENSD